MVARNRNSILIICLLLLSTGCGSKEEPKIPVHEHEVWWEQCLDTTVPMSTFAAWLDDTKAPSRVAMRNYLRTKNYSTFLDVPCGLCIDYEGLKTEFPNMKYQGLDITEKLVAVAQGKNIPVKRGSIEQMPFNDSSFDICYSRHILEHLDNYQKAIGELVRVGSKEVLIVFFIKPDDQADAIDLSSANGALLFHNRYNKPDLEKYVLSLSKVKEIKWEEVNSIENFLHIYLK